MSSPESLPLSQRRGTTGILRIDVGLGAKSRKTSPNMDLRSDPKAALQIEVSPSSLAVAVLWASAFDVKTSSSGRRRTHRKRSPTAQQQPVMTDSPNRMLRGTFSHEPPAMSYFVVYRPSVQELRVEPVSPQPSFDRLSVTFAGEDPGKSPSKPPHENMTNEKVRFHAEPIPEQDVNENELPDNEEDDDEYSASVSAIMSRSASVRKSSRRRRPSSPFSPDPEGSDGLRRRSSVFTTSSMGSGVSTAEENTAQEMIFHKMKIHKEVLSQIKYQPWPMRKKIRLVQTAKAYIKRHEGALQERLAQKKNTKDVLEHVNIVLINLWHRTRREFSNLSNTMIPWEKRIKQIESHFGSVVASYFTFLRWLFWVNLVSAFALVLFVAVPEILFANRKNAGERKELLPEEKLTATNLVTLWNFQGILKYSPFFYGYYMSDEENGKKHFWYRLPTAYFITGLGVYIYSFIAILRKMAENSRQSKLSEKEDECVFSWKIFTAWDYMIGNPETAHNRTASIILGFKEVLLEEAEKNREDARNWKMMTLRSLAHVIVLGLIVTSVFAVVHVVQRSLEPGAEKSWLRQSEVTFVFTIIGSVYPMLFDAIGYAERYHPRKALRMQLARIMVLNLLNLYSFIFATFSQIHKMSERLLELKPIVGVPRPTATSIVMTTLKPEEKPISVGPPECFRVPVECDVSSTSIPSLGILTTLLIANMTSPTIPTYENTADRSVAGKPYPTPSYIESSYNKSAYNDSLHENTTSFEDISWTEGEYEEFWKNFNTTDGNGNFTPELNFTSIENTLFGTANTSLNETSSIYTDYSPTTSTSTENTKNEDLFTVGTTVENNNDTVRANESDAANVTKESGCFIIQCSPTHLEGSTLERSTTTMAVGNSSGVTQEPDAPEVDLSTATQHLDIKTRKELRDLCWETMFGQELVKLTVMDLVATVTSILMMDFFRALFVRLMNRCWCWDLEKTFPLYGDFKIAENILHLVNNQGMVWMGMFFSPLLPLINIVKLIVILYMRSWAVMTCNIPHEVVFKASRSNNFYLALLLTMLFLCVLPVGYAIVWIRPSWHCGPFSNYKRIYFLFTSSLKKVIPKAMHKVLDYIASPGIVIPLLMLLVLIIYYLVSLTYALREANNDLKIQLRRERTEERRKVFQLADKRRRGTDAGDSNFTKWNKLLESVPEDKSPRENFEKPDQTPKNKDASDSSSKKGTGIFSKFLKKTSKSSNTSEEGFPQLENDNEKSHHKTRADTSKVKEHKDKRDHRRTEKESIGLQHRMSSKEESKETDDCTEVTVVENQEHESPCAEDRAREDSIGSSSAWSSDNIPEIKIIESSGENRLAGGSKSSSSDTVIAVGVEDGRKRAPLARSKLNSDDLSDDLKSLDSSSYKDMTESIKKIHSLTNVKEV